MMGWKVPATKSITRLTGLFFSAGHLARPVWDGDTLRSRTDRVAKGKYHRMEQEDIKIVERVHQLAEKHGCKMSQIALAWQWAKGVASPIVGATRDRYLDEAAGALEVQAISKQNSSPRSAVPAEMAFLESNDSSIKHFSIAETGFIKIGIRGLLCEIWDDRGGTF